MYLRNPRIQNLLRGTPKAELVVPCIYGFKEQYYSVPRGRQCGGGRTHRADREPLLRAAGENSTGEAAAATTGRPFLPPGRERGLGAALPRVLRAEPPGVRGEPGADGNMAGDQRRRRHRHRHRPALPPGAR